MWLNVFLFVVIIALWTIVSVYGYSFYSSTLQNHYKFSMLYQAGFLNIYQCVLGIVYVLGITENFQSVRWTIFSFIELTFLFFILRTYTNRHIELIITSVFLIFLLMSTIMVSLIFNIILVLILVGVSLCSKDDILRKWFSVSFILYGFTSIIPAIFGFTQVESLLIGVAFSLHFMIGVRKLYHKEKTDENLKKLINEGKL